MAVSKKSPAKKAVAAKKPVVKKTAALKKPAVAKKERYGAVPKYPSPTPSAIKYLRESCGFNADGFPILLQQHAATLVKSNLSTYGKWETGVVPMHPGLWELLQLKVAQFIAGEIPHPVDGTFLVVKKIANKK